MEVAEKREVLYVAVKKEHLKAYGYKGNEKVFYAVEVKNDGYSEVYNLIDKHGKVAVYNVLKEDLIKIDIKKRGELYSC